MAEQEQQQQQQQQQHQGEDKTPPTGDAAETTTSAPSKQALPPLQFAAVHKAGLTVFQNPNNIAEVLDVPGQFRALRYSANGKYLAIAHVSEGMVRVLQGVEPVHSLAHPNVVNMVFSPKGTYLATFARFQQGQSQGNLVVWDLSTGQECTRFHQKKEPELDPAQWPLQWSDEEDLCGFLVSNEVKFFDSANMRAGVVAKLPLKRIVHFQLSHGRPPYKVATAVNPDTKTGGSGALQIWKYPEFQEGSEMCRQAYFNADHVSFAWNSLGTAVLMHKWTEVDKSGRSYYGEHQVVFAKADGTLSCIVPLDKEGPVYDVAWSHGGREFVVVYGTMKSKAMLFDFNCKPRFDFGTGYRNTVTWAPHDRFLALCGFGNLQGDMEFWDKNKGKLVGRTQADAVGYQWGANSRVFATSVLHRRLKVDNGFTVWKYDGSRLCGKAYDMLLEFAMRPSDPDVYPNLPASPRRAAAPDTASAAAPSSSAAASASAAAGAEPGKRRAYVPPGMRGRAGTDKAPSRSLSDLVDGPETASAGPRKIAPGGALVGMKTWGAGAGADAGIVGMTPAEQQLSKAALKNKKRREKKQAEQEAAEAAALIERQKASVAAAANQQPQPVAASTDKQIRNLNKKLKAIQALKDKQAAGEDLLPEQLVKLQNEASVRAELETLQQQQ